MMIIKPSYEGLCKTIESLDKNKDQEKLDILKKIKKTVDKKVTAGKTLDDKLFQEIIDNTIKENYNSIDKIKKEYKYKKSRLAKENRILSDYSKKQVAEDAAIISVLNSL